ncbi:hypothetical protein GWK47_037063 [Chionoecetes opilio]|uniref:Uncharacterized protein n=1 Tax=Chionoecetes opilio TaxID=41210 RepID=A0A8J4YNE2_CHIOP|nr:hypothetical protein GWK47_037063 [Chionoecetes opilio]
MALAIHGRWRSSRTAEWFGLDLHHPEEQGRETEKFFIVLLEVLRQSEASFRKAKLILQLAGSVHCARRTLRGPPMFPPSLCEESRRTNRSRSRLKIPMSGPEEEQGCFEDILEVTRGHEAAGQPKQSRPSFLLNPNAKHLHPHFASVEAVVVETEGDDLSLDARFVTSSRPLQHFCQSNPSCRGPKKEHGRHRPL